MKYLEGDKVFVHSLGKGHEGKEYRGIIRGLAVSHITEIWIVELVDPICADYGYSCCTMPSACLRKA